MWLLACAVAPEVDVDAPATTAGVDTACMGYADADGDGYGAGVAQPCAVVAGGAAADGDCDDADVTVHPDQPELCNGREDDCDPTTTDEGIATFSADGVDTPVEVGGVVTLDHPGTLTICPGTYSASLRITADVDVVGDGAELVGGGNEISGEDLSPTVSGLTLSGGGTGLRCSGSVGLTLDEVWIVGNAGGGLVSEGCAVYVGGGGITGNTADEGAGIWWSDGKIELNGAVVSDNHATVRGGGLLMAPGDGEFSELVMGDALVSGNTAPVAAGLALSGDSYVQCYGVDPGQWGFVGNTSEVGGAIVPSGDAVFESLLCDFGASGSADDNLPIDVSTSGGEWAWEDDVRGWCWEEGGCELG